jgi:hypothetical protein
MTTILADPHVQIDQPSQVPMLIALWGQWRSMIPTCEDTPELSRGPTSGE